MSDDKKVIFSMVKVGKTTPQGKEILKNIESELPEKKLKALVIDLIKRMRRIAEPDVSLITNLRNFPNIGLEEKLYRRFRVRCAEALEVFQKELGLLLF